MAETLILAVLIVSGALAVRYGLSLSSARNSLKDRLWGSALAAIGIGALFFGIGIVRAMF
jgi:steroid 5-alpha reductase family enzyme